MNFSVALKMQRYSTRLTFNRKKRISIVTPQSNNIQLKFGCLTKQFKVYFKLTFKKQHTPSILIILASIKKNL